MNREIKFEVRNEVTRKIIGYERVNNQGHFEFQKLGREDWLLGINTSEDDLIRRQFTGLLGVGGIEIYEGDLLRFPSTDEWNNVHFVTYEVFFHDNDQCDSHIGWQMNRTHFQGGVICGTQDFPKMIPKVTKTMYVIGNVFEHSELLK